MSDLREYERLFDRVLFTPVKSSKKVPNIRDAYAQRDQRLITDTDYRISTQKKEVTRKIRPYTCKPV